MKKILCIISFLLIYSFPASAQKAQYLADISRAVDEGWKANPGVIARWRQGVTSNPLWGYDAPAHPVYLASTLAFLYEQTGNLVLIEKYLSGREFCIAVAGPMTARDGMLWRGKEPFAFGALEC